MSRRGGENEGRIVVLRNPVFRPVHRSRCRYVAMKGSAGSGKSYDTALGYILSLSFERGRNLMCVRKSDESNRFSTFAELSGAIRRLGLSSRWRARQNPLSLECANGNRIIFSGVYDDRQRERLKSIGIPDGKLTDIWVEEATELSLSDFEMLDDRLRGILPEGLFYQIKLTFNPVSPSHWLKRRFFDRRDSEILAHHSTYLDNAFIDGGFLRRMELRKELDPDGYRIYGLGEWGETDGLVFTGITVLEKEPDQEDFDDLSLGQDFGYVHKNAVVLTAMRDGDIYVLRELVASGMTTDRLIELAEAAGIPKNVTMYCDSAEPDRIRMWREAGFAATAVKKGAGSLLSSIDFLRSRRIFLSPSCAVSIREMQNYRFRRDRVSGMLTEEPVPLDDDCVAAIRYSCEKWRSQSRIRTISKKLFSI